MSAARMAERLSGKTIVITGASSGIGRSTALEFARTSPKDLRLILTARRIDNLKKLAAEINAEVGAGVKVLPVALDMQDTEAIDGFVENLSEEWRDIDVLINNAGMVRGVDQAPNIRPADLSDILSTNVNGLIHMTQSVMRVYNTRSPPRGDILNLGSIAGREGYPGGSVYCASKAAVRAFTEALRKEQIGTRVRVLGIDPGQVETEFSLVRFNGDKEKAGAVYKDCEPLTPEDVAEVIVFMVGRRENVVVADALLFPSHQGSAQLIHRRS